MHTSFENYFSDGGFIGYIKPDGAKFIDNAHMIDYQYDSFYNGGIGNLELEPYMQSAGFQGFFYTSIMKILELINVKNNFSKMFFMKLITVLLTSILLVMFIQFVLKEFGFLTSLITFLFFLFSQWLVVFSHNLYWMFFLLLSPFIIVLSFYRKNEEGKKINLFCCLFVFISILLKSLAGYEYISTILISIIVPLLYFTKKNNWGVKRFVVHSIAIGASGLIGFLVAIIFHVVQLKFYLSSWQAAISHIIFTIAKRTYGEPSKLPEVYRESLEGSLLTVFKFYSKSKIFDLSQLIGFNFQIRFFMILILLLFLSRFVLRKIRENDLNFLGERKNQLYALVYTTWFSMLAPISWYVLAKGHSYVHTSINHVLWYLPFLLFGFTLISFCINYKVSYYFSRRINSHPIST
ncbi:hypothetical protein [Thorsellia anophelis]|uniref:hypothetical protein n=1 Tax=Thorsellia anophelis TaxID=336804 RepID=UPI00115F821A|nr:hypothetical protein [Thorsellia anophelis]